MKVFLLEDIDKALAKNVMMQLQGIESGEPVEVVIFSQGGDVLSGNAIIRALKNTGSHITTNVIGLASSMAAVISQIGDVRLIAEDASFNLHNAAMNGSGRPTKENHLAAVETLTQIDDLMLKVLSNSVLSANELKTLMSEDVLLSAQDAVALGFFDKISEPVAIAASLNNEIKELKDMNKLESIMKKVNISAIRLGLIEAILTDEEAARLSALQEQESLSEDEKIELDELLAKRDAESATTGDSEESTDMPATAEGDVLAPVEPSGAEVLTSEMVSREEFDAFKAEMMAFMQQVLEAIDVVPSEEQMIEQVETQTTAKLDNVLKAIKSKTTIPVAKQNFEQPKQSHGLDMDIINMRVKEIKTKNNR